jgi:catechol 2,3-dioxygenase-like lactoylglutathione lyase family enzyme
MAWAPVVRRVGRGRSGAGPVGWIGRRADVARAIAAAKRHDVHPIGDPVAIDRGPNRGCRVAYLNDPDGITIEFAEKPA